MDDIDILLNEVLQLLEKSKYDEENKQKYEQQISKSCNDIIEICNKIIVQNPNNAAAYSRRGYIKRMCLQNYQDAIADFDKAIELEPKNNTFYSDRAYTKRLLGDVQGAQKDYRLADELSPGYYFNEQIYYVKNKITTYKDVIKYYSNCIEFCPDNEYAYYCRGCAKELSKDFKGALSDYSKAIKLKSSETPYMARYYNLNGIVKHNLKDYKGAISDYIKVLSFKQNEIPTFIIYIKIIVSYIKLLLHL